jgi:DNA-directed RNA polymerase III subunit RPC2
MVHILRNFSALTLTLNSIATTNMATNGGDKPIKELEDKWKMLPAFLEVRGLVKQHIQSFDYFINVDMRNILEANSEVKSDTDPRFFFRYTNIYVGVPTITENMSSYEVTPHECRLRSLSYCAPIYVDVRYTRGEHIVVKRKVPIGNIPIMLGSSNCVLKGKTEAQLSALQECPYDPGGYFVVKGTEKVILIQEQLSKNRVIIEVDDKGNTKANVTSSTHERKSRSVVHLHKNKIYVQQNVFADDIPFAIMMKAMGVSSDQVR